MTSWALSLAAVECSVLLFVGRGLIYLQSGPLQLEKPIHV